MSKKTRQTNFELLRIAAMFMVMILHYLLRTGLLPEAGEVPGGKGSAAVIAESFCVVAVNVYVLISGYFLSAAAFSWKRIAAVIGQVLFYALLIPPVLVILGLLDVQKLTDVYHLWNCLFPVQTGHYWFASAYIVMCLFSPLINAAIWQLEPKCFAKILAGLLLFFSIGKTISPLQFATDRYGYEYGWFLCVYLIGAWIRRFGFFWMKNIRRALAVYLGSVLLTAGMELALLGLAVRIPALTYYASVPFHYNFLPCITGAVGLFACFYYMRIPDGAAAKIVSFFAPAAFGVYLIHEHVDVSLNWCRWMTEWTGFAGPVILIPAFTGCLLIDKLRAVLFGWIGLAAKAALKHKKEA